MISIWIWIQIDDIFALNPDPEVPPDPEPRFGGKYENLIIYSADTSNHCVLGLNQDYIEGGGAFSCPSFFLPEIFLSKTGFGMSPDTDTAIRTEFSSIYKFDNKYLFAPN